MRSLTNIIALTAVAATAAVAVQSCSDDAALRNSSKQTVTIMASVAEQQTSRTAIDRTEYADGRTGILWTDGDQVGVYSNEAKNVLFTTTETGGRVPFTGKLNATDRPRYAYYPWSADNDGLEATDLKGTLPLNQKWTPGATIDGDYKYGTPRNNTDNEFDFKNLFALLRFNVNATGTALEGERLQSVGIELPAGRTLGGDFRFNATTGSYTMAGGEGTNRLTLEWQHTPELTKGTTVTGYASTAADVKAGDKITVTVTTDKRKASFDAEAAYDFIDDVLYTFTLTLSAYDDGQHGFAVEEIGGGDEPADEETANCYMITEAGEHSFLATVIGNGEKGIIKGAGFHTENPYINPQSAKLLWEDTKGFISNVELKQNGRVYYTTTGNTGNAVIAVYSGANCTGDILWSWHIWGVGPTLPEDFNIDTKAGSTFAMMDRDLGAFPSTDEQRMQETKVDSDERQVIHAMLYQWGRKDPFPNTDFFDGEGNVVSIATSKYNLSKPTAEEATIVNAVRNPTSIIDLVDLKISDWLYDHNELLWGDDRNKGPIDGGWTDVKTIYDPSPVGCRVANYYAYTSFIPGNSVSQQLKGVMSKNTTTGMPSLTENISCVVETYLDGTSERWLPRGIHMSRIGMSIDNKSQHGYGIYMKRNNTDNEGNFFAQTGYLINGAISDYGLTSYRWMSSGGVQNTGSDIGAVTGNIDCGAFELNWFAWRTSSYNTGVNKGLPQGGSGVVGTIKTNDYKGPRYGCAVRCVREK